MIIFDLFEQGPTPVGKDIKDVATKAAIIKARMAHPSATSDTEALAKDMLDTQKRDEEDLAQAQEINTRQDELLQQIRKLDRRQDDEIDNIEDEENDLVAQVKRLQAANAKLAQTIANMKGKKAEVAETEVGKKSPHEQGMADIYYRGRGNAQEHGYIKGTPEFDQYIAGLKQGREDFGQEGEYGKDYTEEGAEPSDVEAFLKAGGKIQQVKAQRGPRRPGLSLSSRHIGGGGDKMKTSRTGRGANTQGKPVVSVEEEDTQPNKELSDLFKMFGQTFGRQPGQTPTPEKSTK